MKTSAFKRFRGLLRREFLEHPNLFVTAPVGLMLLILLTNAWAAISAGNYVEISNLAGLFAEWLQGYSVAQLSLMMFPLGLPFALLLGLCIILYLSGTLYQDRRDLSVLFWHSMPVSNFTVVLSKIFTAIFIAPLAYMLVMLVVYLAGLGGFAYLELNQSIETDTLVLLLQAVLRSLGLMYLTMVLSVLLLFPLVGWILLFSAFAKRTPLLWALGMLILVFILEDLIFETQYLADWSRTRAASFDFVVSSATGALSGLLDREFLYDLGIGIAFGSILVIGAVLMRRFSD